jgi:hypothetical protein
MTDVFYRVFRVKLEKERQNLAEFEILLIFLYLIYLKLWSSVVFEC